LKASDPIARTRRTWGIEVSTVGAGVGGTGVGVGAAVVGTDVGDGVVVPPVGVAVGSSVLAAADALGDGEGDAVPGVVADEHAAASATAHTSARSGRVMCPTLRHNGCRTRPHTR
jgi:hypothetical protein